MANITLTHHPNQVYLVSLLYNIKDDEDLSQRKKNKREKHSESVQKEVQVAVNHWVEGGELAGMATRKDAHVGMKGLLLTGTV